MRVQKMFIDFISISADPEEFDDLEDFLYSLEGATPSIRRPVSISTDEIIRFEQSIYSED